MLFFSEFETPFPPIDIYETKDSLIVEVEVPGMTSDDLKITCIEDKIVIEGDKRERINAPQIKFIRMERYTGLFKRTVKLPFKPQVENIKGSIRDGILTIRINKNIKKITVEENKHE